MTRAERDELLALWDAAVLWHRLYWRSMQSGRLTSAVKDSDLSARTKWILAALLSGPDGVALGN